jgi:hypothetical protein
VVQVDKILQIGYEMLSQTPQVPSPQFQLSRPSRRTFIFSTLLQSTEVLKIHTTENYQRPIKKHIFIGKVSNRYQFLNILDIVFHEKYYEKVTGLKHMKLPFL